MCGIVGVAKREGAMVPIEIMRQWTNSLHYRGPDGDGLLVATRKQGLLDINRNVRKFTCKNSFTGSIGLGHTRLSINDLSEQGFQPLCNKEKTCFLAHNGEIYNYKSLRKNLEAKGYIFTTNSDSEVIIHIYSEYGIEGLNQLSGSFAFALLDLTKDCLILGRDHFGEKPLYYHPTKKGLFFASELKSLTDYLDIDISHISEEAMASYFSFGHIVAPFTWYKNVFKLCPGEILIFPFSSGKLQSHFLTYFRDDEKKISLTAEDAQDQLNEILLKSIEEASSSDESISKSLLLSGGIDSSLAAFYLTEAQVPFDNLTMFNESLGKLSEDYKRAGTVHQLTCAKKHRFISINENDIYSSMWERLSHVDEPIQSIIDIHMRYQSYSSISKYATVAMTAATADHCFLTGALHHGAAMDDQSLAHRFTLPSTMKMFHQIVPRRINKYFSPFHSGSYVANYYRNNSQSHEQFLPNLEGAEKVQQSLHHRFTKYNTSNSVSTSLLFQICVRRQHILYLDDLVGYRYGLEVRDLFLNRQAMAFMISLPDHLVYPSYVNNKFSGKNINNKILPRAILRKKMGYQFNNVVDAEKLKWGSIIQTECDQAINHLGGPGGYADITDDNALWKQSPLRIDKVQKVVVNYFNGRRNKQEIDIANKVLALNCWLTAQHQRKGEVHKKQLEFN